MSMAKKTLFIANDHNGNAAKAYIKRVIDNSQFDVFDLGPEQSDGKVDYIDYAVKLCENIKSFEGSKGILICGTGTGMSIVANRFPWIRAAIVTDVATSVLSREHNNANVLVLGQWRNSLGSMDDIVNTWLTTECTEERHLRRLERLENLKC